MEERKVPPPLQQPKSFDFASIEEAFYNNLEEADTLIDYFCIVGPDQQKVQQVASSFQMSREEIINELRSIKP